MFIVITGTIGSGKSTAANYLVSNHGFKASLGTDILQRQLIAAGKELTRTNMRVLANEMRKTDPNKLIDETINAVINEPKALIGFPRSKSEIDRIIELTPHAFILGIDAPQNIRYQRIEKRREPRDQVSFSEFKKQEAVEMRSTDSFQQNVSYCLENSDLIIENNKTLDDFYETIDSLAYLN